MKKYVVLYLVLLPVGAVIAYGISSVIHASLDMPRGVPLSRLGFKGNIAQKSLMLFPFVLSPILTAVAYFGVNRSAPGRRELWLFVANASGFFALLWVFLIFGSGAWFGIIQGSLLIICMTVFGPPMIAMFACLILFPSVIWALVSFSTK